MPKTVVQIDGKPTEVLTLPELGKSDLMGQPIMVFFEHVEKARIKD